MAELPQIKSFVRRSGRISTRQKNALQTQNHWLVADNKAIDPVVIFGREASVVLDIGFGMGRSLLSMAKAAPEIDFIGVDVYKPGVGALLAGIADLQLTNIRVCHADVMDVLQHLPPLSIDRAQLFFPDPWPKRKHHKRRLIQQPFLDCLMPVLTTEGVFHMATDWAPYALEALPILERQAEWQNIAGVNQFALCPDYRPSTKYQQRGERLGHKVYDLILMK